MKHQNKNYLLTLFVLFLIIGTTLIDCSNKSISNRSKRSSRRYKSKRSFRSAYQYPGQESTNSECNKGFGFKGLCLGDAADLTKFAIPSQIKDNWNNNVMPILTKAVSKLPFDACIGDFDGKIVKNSEEKLSAFQCSNLPYEDSSTLGIFGFSLKMLPCGVPTDFQMCLAFDRCGTVGVSINGGSIKCLTYATGIGAVIAEAASVIDQVSFSFSLKRKLTQTLEIATFQGDDFRVREVKTYGHFYIGMGVSLPGDYMRIGTLKLDEFFNVSVTASLMIDFGNTIQTVESIIGDITKNKGNGKSIVQKIMKSGAEVSLRGEGNVTFKLQELSNGILPDISFNVGTLNVLLTLGGGASGVPTGLYVRFNANIIKNLFDALKKVSGHFAGMLQSIGSVLQIDKVADIEGSLAITSVGLGFEFKGSLLAIKCYYNSKNKKGSCKLGSKIFTMLLDAGKWVIKQAAKMFDEAGKEIMRVAAGAGKFATETAKEAIKLAGKAVQEAKRVAEHAANQAEKVAKMGAEEASKIAKESAKKVSDAANKSLDKAKDAANKVKKVFSKWK